MVPVLRVAITYTARIGASGHVRTWIRDPVAGYKSGYWMWGSAGGDGMTGGGGV